jgi:hypothetical protein
LRALILAVAGSALAVTLAVPFRLLGNSAPEFTPPSPSKGTWASEEDFLPDVPEGEPSIFMPNSME